MVYTACWTYKKMHIFSFYTSEAIWRDRRLPDWWKQPECGDNVQVKSWSRTGEFTLIHTFSILTTFTTVVYKNIHLVFLHKKYYPLDCLLFSLSLFLPSKRRLFTVWGSKTRLCAWRGTRPPWLWVQPMLMRESQRRTRFVDRQHIVINCRQKVEC